ncbi:MAG: beta strand repeat-containing protein, partial [Roseimicrobium sp.]
MHLSSRIFTFIGTFALALLALFWSSPSVDAATGTWVPTGGGSYFWLDTNYGDFNTPITPPWGVTGAGTDASPFVLNPTPNAAGDVANINNDIVGNQVITLNAQILLGVLNLGDADGSHSFSIVPGEGGSLVFNNSGLTAQLNKAVGSVSTDTISTNISLVDSLAVAVAAGRIDLTGVISGTGTGITKSGAGTLLVSGANTYNGGTTINEGVVMLGSSTVGGLAGSAIVSGPLGTGTVTIGSTGPVTLQSNSAAARTLSNAIAANGNFTLGATGTGSVMLGGTVNLGGATRTVTAVGNQFITGVISNGGLTLAGAGTLHLRGANTFSGASTLGAGTTTVIGNNAALGTAAITMGDNTLASDTARTITNLLTLTGNLTLGADPRIVGNYDGQLTLGGTINLGGATRTITTNTSGVPTLISGTADTISGVISAGGIIKEGNGRLILSGTNLFTGGVTINAGVLQVGTDLNLGAVPVAFNATAVVLNGGTLAFSASTTLAANRGITVNAASTIDVTGTVTSNPASPNSGLSGSGDLTKIGTGLFALTGNGTNTYSGNLSVVQGTFQAGATGNSGNGNVLGSVTSITIHSGATFQNANGSTALHINTNRVNDAAAVTLNGGTLGQTHTFTATFNYAETYGDGTHAVTLNRGANTITNLQHTTAANTSTLTIGGDLVRNTGATVNFTGAGLGNNNQNRIVLTSVNGVAVASLPGLSLNGAPVAGSFFMPAWATSSTTNDFLKWNSTTNSVQALQAGDYETSTTDTNWTADENLKLTTGTVAMTGSRTVNSLNLQMVTPSATLTVGTGNTLRIASGGILVSGAFPGAINGGTLIAGATVDTAAELIVTTTQAAGHATQIITIGSNITNNGTLGAVSLVKSGTGVLALTGTNTFTGGVYLNQGTIRLAPGLSGTSLALLASNNISVVNGTIASTGTGTLVLGNNITIYDSLTLGDATGAARHMLTGNITLSAPTGGIASIIAHTGTTAQIMGNISGGSLRIAQVGTGGRVALQGTNTFAATDRIQVDSGFLTVGSAGALGSAKIVMNGGGLETGFGFRGAISNDILFTATSTLGGAVHGNPLTLSGNIDLGGVARTINNDTAGIFTEITGVITNGGLVKGGNGIMVISNGNNNYLGGTQITDAFIHLKGSGVAGANVLGNDISITTGTTGDGGIKLDGPSNLGSNQILTFSLPAAMTTGTQALSLGTGFSGNSNSNRMIGFQPVTGGTGTGIMNVRINDVAAGKFLISLDGLTLNQDLIGGVGGTNSAAPNVRVWIGASMAGGTIASPLSAGFGGNYRLGGGLDAGSASGNQAGTLQVNAGVLSGSGILYIGAEDNAALSNITNNSVVWVTGDQAGFSGTVSIGAGGILNVAEGSYLGTGNTITFRGGTLRILNESGLAGFDASHIDNSFATKNINVGVGGGFLRHDSGTGNFSNQVIQFGTLTIDASDITAGNRTFTVSDGGVNSGGVQFTSLTTTGTNQAIFNVSANYARVTGAITVAAGGLQKAGGGTLILDTPSATTLGGALDLNAGTLVLTNPGNFTAPSTTVSGSSTLVARSNAGTYALNIGAVALSGGNLTLVFGNSDGSGPTSSTVTFGSAITTTTTARTLAVRGFDDTTVNGTGAVTMGTGGNVTFDIQAGYYNQSGVISGAAAVVKAGRAVLELSNGSNTFSGGLNAGQGTVLISAAGAQGSGTISFTSGSGLFLAANGINITNALQNFTSSAGTTYFGGLGGSQTFSGTFNIAAAASLTTIAGVANFDPAGITTFTGVISQGNAGVNNILKTGNGTVVFNQINTYGSAAAVTNTVQRGMLEGVAQASGSPFGAAANSFVIGGGALKLTGSASATTTAHTGSLIVGGNNFGGRLVIDATAGGSTTFTVGSLGARSGRSTLVIVPQTGGFGTTENFNITTAPTGANFANGIIAPYVVKQASAASGVGNFVTMLGVAVVGKTYTAGVDQGDLNAIATTGTTVFDNNAATTLTSSKSVYSLRTDSSIDLGGFALNIGDQAVTTNTVSGLILNNNANISGSGNSELHMRSSEMNVFVGTGFTSTISARIASLDATNGTSLPFTLPANVNNLLNTNTGLTKSGEGTLILTGANRYSGTTTVVGGTLQAGAANVIGQFSFNQRRQSSDLQIAAGATFDMSGAGFHQNIGSLAGQGIINIGSNTLTVGNGSILGANNAVATTVFSGQIVASAGATLLKTGVGILELSNLQTGALANSAITNIFVDQGTLRVQVSDGSTYALPNGDTFALQTQSAIVNGSAFTLRGGTLDLRYNHGDVSSNAHTLRTGYNITSLLSSAINTDGGLLAGTNYTNKQITVNNVTVNRFTLTTSSANTNVLQIDGLLTLTENANLSIGSDLAIGVDANITDGGNFYTLNKQGTAALTVNADTTFAGGTVASLGRILFGQRGQWSDSYEETPSGGTTTYNSTAKLGTGNIWLNSYNNSGAINSIRLAETNLNSGQLLFVRSAGLGGHQTQVEVLHDAALSSYNLRSTTQGSLAFLVGPTAGSTNIGRWTNAIDLQRLGNGAWGLSAVTDAVYDNANLGVGTGEIYRFYGSAGGSLVFNHANTLTGTNRLQVGQSGAQLGATNSSNSNAVVLLAADQNYTGATTIFRGSAATSYRNAPANILRVYGDFTTSGIENYGRLELIGAGRLTNDAGVNVVPLTLRIGSYLSLDYISGFTTQVNTAGNYLTDVSVDTGLNPGPDTNKFQDNAILVLPGSTLDLKNFNTRDTHEVIGGLAIAGLSDVVLGTNTNGAMILELGGAITFN